MIDDVLATLERDAAPEAALKVTSLVTRYFESTRLGQGPVSSGVAPNDIAARFDEPMPEQGTDLDRIVERVEREIIVDANRLAHPMYMGHQVSFPLSTAVWTDAVISALNQSVAVEEMSPTLTSLEHRVVRWMCDAVGFPEGSGGTLTSGGTEATFTALLAARAAALPDAWMNGITEPRPVVLCGEHTHYAVTRAVAELGLGIRSAIIIPSMSYRMDVAALERELRRLRERAIPVMAVVATAGQTATGAFDDIDAIGRLCEDLGIWLHIDGAHGRAVRAAPASRARHRACEVDRVGSAQDDAAPAAGRDAAGSLRGGASGCVRAAGAVPLSRRRGVIANPRSGRAELPVLAPSGRAQALGRASASWAARDRGPARSPLRSRPHGP